MASPQEAYHEVSRSSSPERRGVSRKTVIDEVKEKVSVIDFADLLAGPGKMRRDGEEWVTNCLLDDHEDKIPSFCVNLEKNVWFCHGCLRGGDVVELARYAWGYSKEEAPMAAADLLREFGHPIPERPTRWYARQERQRPVRDRIEAERVEHLRDLVFRLVFVPWLRLLPDETRGDAARFAWEKSLPLARQLFERRLAS
jgi:hypothetical protein